MIVSSNNKINFLSVSESKCQFLSIEPLTEVSAIVNESFVSYYLRKKIFLSILNNITEITKIKF